MTYSFCLVALDAVDHQQPVQLHPLQSSTCATQSTRSAGRPVRLQRDTSTTLTQQRVDRHRGQVGVLHAFDRLRRGAGTRLQVLLIGVLRDMAETLEIQRVLVSRLQLRLFIVQNALRNTAEHAIRV